MESSRDSWAAPEAAQRRRSIHIVCREPSQELEKLEAEDLYVPPGVRASSPPREPVRRCNTITRPPPPRRGSTEEGKDSLDQAAKLRYAPRHVPRPVRARAPGPPAGRPRTAARPRAGGACQT